MQKEYFKDIVSKLPAESFAAEELLVMARHQYLECAKDCLKPGRGKSDNEVGFYALEAAIQLQETIDVLFWDKKTSHPVTG